ncbi:DUF5994 family protein [Streptomyces radiopugnans]|uniref:Uncharacterized protein n=1 Tax=Streptomyces radiopugnans TaxID=403935 RepID=A0A1H9CTQ2_9ACTN|nr:DUF5994 family protein [Streptomyces radiopugnans]SEQ04511.1 hypothetical protein SAMN05216481_103428 [Streptomyces radiopugnans]
MDHHRVLFARPGSAPRRCARRAPEFPLPAGAWRERARQGPGQSADVWGHVVRITVDPTGWPVVPREVRVTGRTVRVGWFLDEHHPHELILLSHTAGRCELLVVPPETTGETAAWPAPVATVVGSLLAVGGFMTRGEGTRTVAEPRTGSGGRAAGAFFSPFSPRPTEVEHRTQRL